MSLPPITELIAHRDGMLMLDSVVSVDAESCIAHYTPQTAAWYADEKGNMPAWIGIELMAQTIAAHVALCRDDGQPPRQGVLLGTRSYTAARDFFDAAEALQIEAKLVFRDESGLAAFDCAIAPAATPEEVLVSATIKVFEPDDFETFLKGKSA